MLAVIQIFNEFSSNHVLDDEIRNFAALKNQKIIPVNINLMRTQDDCI